MHSITYFVGKRSHIWEKKNLFIIWCVKNVLFHCNIAFHENSISKILQNFITFYLLFHVIWSIRWMSCTKIFIFVLNWLYLFKGLILLSRSNNNNFIHVPMRYLISFNKLYFLLRDHAKISYLIIIDTRVMVLIKRVMFPLSCIHPWRRSV